MKKLHFFLQEYRFEFLCAFSLILFFAGIAMDSVRKNHPHTHISLGWICLSWAEVVLGFCLIMYSIIAHENEGRQEIADSVWKELKKERLARFAESLK